MVLWVVTIILHLVVHSLVQHQQTTLSIYHCINTDTIWSTVLRTFKSFNFSCGALLNSLLFYHHKSWEENSVEKRTFHVQHWPVFLAVFVTCSLSLLFDAFAIILADTRPAEMRATPISKENHLELVEFTNLSARLPITEAVIWRSAGSSSLARISLRWFSDRLIVLLVFPTSTFISTSENKRLHNNVKVKSLEV